MSRATKKIKHIFWPHNANSFKPLLIQAKGLVVVIIAIVLIGTAANLARTGQFKVLSFATDITLGGLLSETNQERSAVGLSALTNNSFLNSAAQSKANHMASNNYWAHVAPDGTTPWDFIDTTGYNYLKAGENLAYGFLTSSGTVDGWMDSPGHRANLLDNSFNEVGFGITDSANYQGGEYTIVVAIYASAIQTTQPVVSKPQLPILTNPPETLQEFQAENSNTGSAPNIFQQLQVSRDPTNYPTIALSSPVLQEKVSGRVITNLEALIKGQAPISMYLTISLLLVVGFVYALRHVRIIHNYILVGEHTLEGHPLIEASIIYALIWLVLSATYGVII